MLHEAARRTIGSSLARKSSRQVSSRRIGFVLANEEIAPVPKTVSPLAQDYNQSWNARTPPTRRHRHRLQPDVPRAAHRDRFLDGYGWNSTHRYPPMDVVDL